MHLGAVAAHLISIRPLRPRARAPCLGREREVETQTRLDAQEVVAVARGDRFARRPRELPIK